MRTIGARLTIWYALSATVTLAVLFFAGYQLLDSRLTRGLDDLNGAEFRQLKSHLGSDYKSLNSVEMERRIRETSESGSVLFYISIRDPKSEVQFHSHNLGSDEIPDIKGKRAYDTAIPRAGEVRADEFLLPPFDVTIATSAASMRDGMREYGRICALLLVVMMAASLGIGRALSHMLLEPMRAIRETATRIGSDNLSERIPVGEVEDELSDLSRLLNATFDRLESAFDQIRRFSQEASHELKTPLSLIRLHAEQMLGDGDLAPVHAEAVLVQIEELARLNQIIDEMLFLSRAEANAISFNLGPHDPRPFLDAFSQDACALCEHHGLQFNWRHEGAGCAIFEEKWIRQVLLNVLSNAIAVSPPAGRLVLVSTVADGLWRVSLEDQGPGLSAEQRERIFERFVRFNVGAGGERGCGLGLTICRSIIEQHGGRIAASASPGGTGLIVAFDIPAGPLMVQPKTSTGRRKVPSLA